jgi:magnesium-protoporphyrin O-methyltransferase
MAGCCPPYQCAAERQFDDKKVAQEVKQYRAHGLGPTTRLLERGIAESRAAIETVLDVGSGIGTLALSLLERGATSAIAVDASSACLKAAREEAERQGRAAAIRFAHGDFVALADRLPPASVVTLDRVVCCYPRYEPLLEKSLIHATSVLALSYPRDVWYVRLAVMAENGQRRLRGNPFRAFVHPAARIEQLIRRAGFERSSRRETWMWAVDVYLRRDDNLDST